ncbi:MAG: AIR synthase related protein [Candidatus Bathyarchaeota archaeon]|nr:AIR synthase related protein [Candidatus Bathyarchaeota archaeon]
MVVGCDSSGGVGPKPLDKIKVDGFTLGKFIARVALMEVLAVGAAPACIVDTLCVEPEPLGAEILRGVRAEAEKVGLDPRLAVTGSAEKNFQVEQTGMGITVIGICRRDEMKIGVSRSGDVVAAVGIPCVGYEVISAENMQLIANAEDILRLRETAFVHEILPVGSRGIAYEVNVLAKDSRLRFKLADKVTVDLKKSAGPGTVVLASLEASKFEELKAVVNKPANIVAHLL